MKITKDNLMAIGFRKDPDGEMRMGAYWYNFEDSTLCTRSGPDPQDFDKTDVATIEEIKLAMQ